ncbi:MAG: hypothetical protein A2X08_00495 [Bacteroidetes bacterium GWA2_32_17]|nr:MAG: hypothetical protein A2X08_00495 [Bacteroidetes bacterium GWA2_32_17]
MKTSRNFGEEKHIKIVNLYKQGLSSLDIAHLLQISRSQVDSVLKIRNEFVFNFEKKKRDQQIINLFEQGKSVKDICKQLNRCSKTVKTVLIARGLLIKKYKNVKIRKRDETICQLYSDGKSMSDIAKELELCETTVYYAVSRIGISRLPGLLFRNERNKKIIELIEENKNSKVATEATGLNKTSVCDIVRYAGKPLSKIKEDKIKKRNIHICQFYTQGMPIGKIAKKIKMQRHTIRRILRSEGVYVEKK